MRSRMTLATVFLVWCVLGAAGAAAAADQVIFVVRHAERADAAGVKPPAGMMADDPPLSDAGRERAKRLAALLASADVKHVFTTEFLRTRQTAAPLAEAAKITAVSAPARDVAAMAQKVRGAAGNVLVVGHSNTVPELLKQFGVPTPIAIPDDEYDNLFVVVRPATGAPTLIRLRY